MALKSLITEVLAIQILSAVAAFGAPQAAMQNTLKVGDQLDGLTYDTILALHCERIDTTVSVGQAMRVSRQLRMLDPATADTLLRSSNEAGERAYQDFKRDQQKACSKLTPERVAHVRAVASGEEPPFR